MPTLPDHSINYTAVLPAASSVTAGQVLIPNANVTGYVVATTANRGTRGSECVALSSYSGSGVGSVRAAQNGILPASLSGLAAGLRSLVRCSATGSIERVASYTSGDDIIGYAEADGRVHLHFGLPWEAIAAIAAGVATPLQSVQYNRLSAIKGAADVAISADASESLCVGVLVGTVATEGQIRFPSGGTDGAGWEMYMRDDAGAANVCIMHGYVSSIAGVGKQLGIGHDYAGTPSKSFQGIGFGANKICSFVVDATIAASCRHYATQDTVGFITGNYVNMGNVFGGNLDVLDSGVETHAALFCGGEGVGYWGRCFTQPSTNPDLGICWYVARTNFVPYFRNPSGETTLMAGWGEVLANSAGGTQNNLSTLTAEGNPARTLRVTASTTLTGLTGGTADRRLTIIPASGDGSVSVSLDDESASSAAANRIILTGDTSATLTTPFDLVYDATTARWRLQNETTTFVTLAGIEELTNKTITTATITGTTTVTGSAMQVTGNARARAYTNITNAQTTDATVTTIFDWAILDEAVTFVTVEVGAVQSTGAATAAYVRKVRIKRDGGTVTVGTVESTYTSEEAAFATCEVTIDNNTSDGRVRITGVAATTIDWGVIVSRLEVSHA